MGRYSDACFQTPAAALAVRTGAENTNGVADWREQLELGPDAPPPPPPALPPFRRLAGPNLWPDEADCPRFRPAIEAVMSGMGVLTSDLLEALGEGLGLAPGQLQGSFVGDEGDEGMGFCMKVCRYPPVAAGSDAEAGAGQCVCVRPSDTTATAQTQRGRGTRRFFSSPSRRCPFASRSGGARGGGAQRQRGPDAAPAAAGHERAAGAQQRGGVGRHPAAAGDTRREHRGATSIGDRCALFTNGMCNQHVPEETARCKPADAICCWCAGGYLVATVHRVLAQRGAAARISIPYFNNGAPSCRVQPLGLPEGGLQWRRGAPPLRSAADSGTHGGKNTVLPCAGANVFKSYARSHPRAFAKNHPDLEISPSGDIVVRPQKEQAPAAAAGLAAAAATGNRQQ